MIELNQLELAAQTFTPGARVAVLTGAGISKESGIPTFREAQTGLWAQFDPQQLATPDAFRRDPDLVWAWYRHRAAVCDKASPNAGHLALHRLEDLVRQVVVLTQNVDGLHVRAGSTDVVELHGSLARYKCSRNCQGSPTFIDIADVSHNDEHAPLCPHCGEPVRPDVVWFGEPLRSSVLRRATVVARTCNIMMIVGTSGLVHPAASLPALARDGGATIIEINPDRTPITPLAHTFLQGPSGEVLPQLIDVIAARREAAEGSRESSDR